MNLLNETRIKACVARFDAGSYSRLQFLRAVSHCMGAHTDAFLPSTDSSDNDDSDDEQPSALEEATVSASSSPTSRQAETEAVAAAAVSDTCCEVCFVAPLFRSCTSPVWARTILY